MKTYIGVKLIEAEPCKNKDCFDLKSHPQNGDGYRVRYSDGYESWCPKKQFEAANFPLEEGDMITEKDVLAFVPVNGGLANSKMGDKTAVAQARCLTGFEITESAACVDPANYDQEMGTGIALQRIKDQLWGHLGFVLQWAKNGLKGG